MAAFKKFLVGASIVMSGLASAAPVFVGSWHVGDGPLWSSGTPAAYSGQQAAALLFGGVAADYAISTIDDQIANINNSAWMDQNGFGITGIHAESLSNGAFYTYSVYSAYVLDNSCFDRYNNPQATCNDGFVNYAFRLDNNDVPEPQTLALMGLALAGLAISRRRKPVAK